MDLREHRITDLAARVGRRELSARELVGVALARIEAVDTAVNAFVAVDGERAMADAAALDERLARGEAPGPLCGLPLGVKDTEDVAGYRTTYGSHLWDDAPLAEHDSVLVARLRAAGCIVVGKTNTPELATKATTDNALFGTTANPWDLARTCGGSSGGAAAAVSAGMVAVATGSDGGGSIRIPSSACGLTGFKPSLGRVPDGGPRPVDWQHLTTRGVLAFAGEDVVAAYDACVGPEPSDLRSLPAPSLPWAVATREAGRPVRIGWSRTLGYAECDDEIAAICEQALAALGVEIVDVGDVFDNDPGLAWSTLVSVYNRRTYAGREDRFAERDAQVASYDGIAANVTAADMVAAEDTCHRMNVRLVEVFKRVDLLATPTLATPTPLLGDVSTAWVRHTYPFNMTRSPAGTVTAGFSAGRLPVGLQLVGPQHADVAVLAALLEAEALLGLDRIPPL
jgi:aspartyl-tRNA(Asn)/glutamyl-tRNA(Gln) amidotransferase subunit A